jgi:predicted PurR-regulated permease PerM
METSQLLDISWKTIIKIFVAVFALYFIYLARNIVLWLFFGLAISVLLDPAISSIRRFRVPKMLAIVFVYVGILGILGILIYLSAPVFIIEL